MEDASDSEHAPPVKGDGGPDRRRAPADPEHGEASEVQDHERDAAWPVDFVGHGPEGVGTLGNVVRIEPANERGPETGGLRPGRILHSYREGRAGRVATVLAIFPKGYQTSCPRCLASLIKT